MRAITYAKMAGAAAVCCIGGPALVYYIQPDSDELFKKYSPELQKKVLSEREARLKEHADYIEKLKEYGKSDRPIWYEIAEDEKRRKTAELAERWRMKEEMEKQREAILEEQRRRN